MTWKCGQSYKERWQGDSWFLVIQFMVILNALVRDSMLDLFILIPCLFILFLNVSMNWRSLWDERWKVFKKLKTSPAAYDTTLRIYMGTFGERIKIKRSNVKSFSVMWASPFPLRSWCYVTLCIFMIFPLMFIFMRDAYLLSDNLNKPGPPSFCRINIVYVSLSFSLHSVAVEA